MVVAPRQLQPAIMPAMDAAEEAEAVRDGDGCLVTPELLVQAYAARLFPMADDRHGPIRWYHPATRAIITWERWKVPPSLRKVMAHEPYRLSIDRAFPAVIAACAERSQTWISPGIERLYTALHRRGVAHSVEAWRGDELVGGLYGLALGGCFCGESMFHRADDASKICMVHLAGHLRARGFTLIDCQQQTPHMRRFGACEIGDAAYARLLAAAVTLPVTF
jgi:leucyl/phenylalanyl-tRNA--protein transferase